MYKNILVPIAADHDPNFDAVLNIARTLADDGAKITVLTVVEALPGYVTAELPEGQMEKTRAEVAAGLKEDLSGADDVTIEVVSGHSARTILDWAEAKGVDCIVIASHQPGLSDFFLGSTAARVVRHASCAVHVMR